MSYIKTLHIIIAIQFISSICMANDNIKNIESTDFFTKECLDNFSTDGLPTIINEQLARSEKVLPQAEKLVEPENLQTEALGKRIEIARRLESRIKELINRGGKENLIFAWQGAEELRIMLNYFNEKQKHLQYLKKRAPYKVISVDKFGAVGDGKTDDGPAIQRALDTAVSMNEPVTVKIPAGTYLINNHSKSISAHLVNNVLPAGSPYPIAMQEDKVKISGKRYHLLVINAKDITVEGTKNTKLLFTDSKAMAIRILGGENIILRNFSIDYVNLPFTQGTITGVNNETGALTFKLNQGYPSPAEPRFMQAPSRRLTPRMPDGQYGLKTYRLGKIENLGNNTFQIYPSIIKPGNKMWDPQEVGLKANIIARYDPFEYDAYAIDLRYCKFCAVEDVTVYSSPAGAFRTMWTYAVSLIRNKVMPSLNSGRLTSTNADGCQNNGLIAAFIKDCVFSQLEDDGINFNSITSPVESINKATGTIKPAVTGGAMFVDSITGKVHAISRFENGKTQAIIPDSIRTKENFNWDKLTHQQKSALGFWNGTNKKFEARPDRIITIPGISNGGIISNCEFHNIRGLGVQITSPNTLIENCKFSGNSGSAMHINSMLGWGFVFNVHNVTVRNCVFENYRRVAVSCSYHSIGSDHLPSRQISFINFENNIFRQIKKESMQIENCTDINIAGNKFFKEHSKSTIIRCINSSNVVGLNNTFIFPNASSVESFNPPYTASKFINNKFINQ